MLNGKTVLVTGATGSFGQKFVETVLEKYDVKKLIIFSRDEMKQFDMAQRWSEEKYPALRYFIGDVRDKDRLMMACSGVDIIIHAAAIKHITVAERNPMECIATNVLGAENIIQAAIANKVSKVVALSTDKAANPINLYGATKLCSDKLFVAANNLSGTVKTRFSVVRYGNVIGSRGSVIPFFKKLAAQGVTRLPITDPSMTRFVITLDKGVDLVLRALSDMLGGEIFVPRLPSIKVTDLVPLITGSQDFDIVGIRAGEKLHEVMIPAEESRNCIRIGDYYVIQPQHSWWDMKAFSERASSLGEEVAPGWEYASGTNDWWVTPDELKQIVASVEAG